MPMLKFEEKNSTSYPVSQLRPKPTVRLKVNCGCGAVFGNVTAAYDHAVVSNHTLHITGEIRSVKL